MKSRSACQKEGNQKTAVRLNQKIVNLAVKTLGGDVFRKHQESQRSEKIWSYMSDTLIERGAYTLYWVIRCEKND